MSPRSCKDWGFIECDRYISCNDLVQNKALVKSIVESAKAPEHKFNTSLLEVDEVINHFMDKTFYLNLSIDAIANVMFENENCVFMFSRSIHNINDMFCQYLLLNLIFVQW